MNVSYIKLISQIAASISWLKEIVFKVKNMSEHFTDMPKDFISIYTQLLTVYLTQKIGNIQSFSQGFLIQ